VDFLSWLASWLGLTLEGTWSTDQKRAMVANAVELYAWRGTPRGLRRALLLMAGLVDEDVEQCPLPNILEDYTLRRWLFLSGSTLGDHSTLWGARIVDRLQLGEHSTIGSFKLTDLGDPLRDPFHHFAHRFTVFVPGSWFPAETDRRMVERVVEFSKPAHTQHRVEFVEPRFRIEVQSTIGMDTAIGRYPTGVTEGEATIGYDAVLQDPANQPSTPRVQLGVRSQLDSTVL
jgi:hypothetical protein